MTALFPILDTPYILVSNTLSIEIPIKCNRDFLADTRRKIELYPLRYDLADDFAYLYCVTVPDHFGRCNLSRFQSDLVPHRTSLRTNHLNKANIPCVPSPLFYIVPHYVFCQMYFSASPILPVFSVPWDGLVADDLLEFIETCTQDSVAHGAKVDSLTTMTWLCKRSFQTMAD